MMICKSRIVQLLSARVDVALLLALLLGVFIQGCLFLVGIACSPWPMWISFSAVAIILAISDRRKALAFCALVLACLFLTAFSYSYTGADTMDYHFPMQDLLRRGWNPVRVATIEDFHQLLGGLTVSEIHTLFLPRLNALCGALVGLSSGLFVADAFLNYVLVLVLLATAHDFAHRVWHQGRFMSMLFAFSLTFTTKLAAFLYGYVDYITYAGIMIMLMSAALYFLERKVFDLLLLSVAIVVSTLAKTTGLVVSVLLCACMLPFLWKDRRCWCFWAASAFYVVIVGCSPLITSWINYGCPLYPTMSWSLSHPVIDITADFTGNADALRMGYVARSLYAWVSPAATVKLCSLVYDNPNFNPVFTVFGGVDGFGSGFRVVLLASVIALVASKKNIVTAMCGFIFLTTLVTPLKYVGFSRYFPQIWAIPALALFNLAAFSCCNKFFGNHCVKSLFKISCIALPVMVAAFCALRTLAFGGRCLAIEASRQRALAELKTISGWWRHDGEQKRTYTLARRMGVAGIDCVVGSEGEPGLPSYSYDEQYMWASVEKAGDAAEAVHNEFFIVNSAGQILRFPWRKAFTSCPSILWYGFSKTGGDTWTRR